jgi:hypothetical protein
MSNETLRNQLLLDDLKNWNESFWKNEEAGERRLNFYLTLVTAVMGGLVALYQYNVKEGGGMQVAVEVVERVAPKAIVGLLVVGVITFMRMVHRDHTTDDYKERADAVRRLVLGKELDRLYPEPPPRSNRSRRWRPVLRTARSVFGGGLVMTMLVLNSLLFGVLMGLVSAPRNAAIAWRDGVWAFLGAAALQLVFSGLRHRNADGRRTQRNQMRSNAA